MKINSTMNNNKLIAEFMKLEFSKGEYYRPLYNSGDWIPQDELQYYTSWDWLMPVVDKIESFEDDHRCCKYNVNIQQCWVEIIDNENSDEIVAVDGYDKKAATYNAVVEFIKWYNKNQKA